MVDSRLLVRIDALPGLLALALVVAALFPVAEGPVFGFVALVTLAVGYDTLWSFVSEFLAGVHNDAATDD